MEIPHNTKPRPDTGLYNGKLGLWLFLASEVMLFGGLFSAYVLLRTGALAWPKGELSLGLGTLNTIILVSSSVLVMTGYTALKLKQFDRFRFYHAATILLAVVFLGIKSVEWVSKFKHYEIWLTDAGVQELESKHTDSYAWLKPATIIPGKRSITGHIEGNPWLLSHRKFKQAGITEIVVHPDIHDGESKGHPAPLRIPVSHIHRMTAYVPAHSSYFALYFTITGLHALHVLGGLIVLGYLGGPGLKMWHSDPERFTNRIELSVVYWHFVDFIWLIVFPLFYLL